MHFLEVMASACTVQAEAEVEEERRLASIRTMWGLDQSRAKLNDLEGEVVQQIARKEVCTSTVNHHVVCRFSMPDDDALTQRQSLL